MNTFVKMKNYVQNTYDVCLVIFACDVVQHTENKGVDDSY